MLPQPDGATLLYRSWEEPYSPVQWETGLPAGTQLTAVPMGVETEPLTLTVGDGGLVDLEMPLGIGYRVEMPGKE